MALVIVPVTVARRLVCNNSLASETEERRRQQKQE